MMQTSSGLADGGRLVHVMTKPGRTGCEPVLVVVTGVPGSGKTTLARRLAAALGLPLFSLDGVKEPLYDAPGGVRRSSGELRLTAEAVVAALLREAPAGAVLDIWIDPTRDDRRRLRAVLPPGVPTREVYCDVPAEVALRRYAGRVRHGAHRPADPEVLHRIAVAVVLMAEGGEDEPSGLGPVIRVDTAREVVVPDLVGLISGSLRRGL